MEAQTTLADLINQLTLRATEAEIAELSLLPACQEIQQLEIAAETATDHPYLSSPLQVNIEYLLARMRAIEGNREVDLQALIVTYESAMAGGQREIWRESVVKDLQRAIGPAWRRSLVAQELATMVTEASSAAVTPDTATSNSGAEEATMSDTDTLTRTRSDEEVAAIKALSLQSTDTCDRDGPSATAAVRVHMGFGETTLCARCFRINLKALRKIKDVKFYGLAGELSEAEITQMTDFTPRALITS